MKSLLKEKKTTFFIFIYSLLMVIFSFVYWIAWNINPDFFIVHEQFNRYPLESLWTMTNIYSGETKITNDAVKLNDLAAIAEKYKKDYLRINQNLQQYNIQLSKLNKEVEAAFKTLNDDRFAKIKDYEKKQQESFIGDIPNIEKEIKDVDISINKGGDALYLSRLRIKRANLNVKLANANLEKSKKELDLSTYILSNLSSFADPKLLDLAKKTESKIVELQDLTKKIRDELPQLRVKAEEEWRRLSKIKLQRLGFIDFLYFSLSTSTTTTFGDIIPNGPWIRFFVTLQLFISVLIVGIFVGIATKKI